MGVPLRTRIQQLPRKFKMTLLNRDIESKGNSAGIEGG
jgi:hypothetical protein